MTTKTSRSDLIPVYEPPAYAEPTPVRARVATVWQFVRATPGRAALGTVAVFAAMVALLAARPIEVEAVAQGRAFDANCGANYFLAGHPNAAVEMACRNAYAGRAVLLAVSLAVLAGVVVALGALRVMRPEPVLVESALTGWRAWVGTPGRAALATAAALSLLVLEFALIPVRAHGVDGTQRFSATCSISSYLYANGSDAVDRACHVAYAGHAVWFFISAAAFLALALVLATLAIRGRDRGTN